MSAQEFGEWFVYMTREQLHPENDRIRHAQLRSDVLSGPATPVGRKQWDLSDFMELDAWPMPRDDQPEVPLREQIETLNRWIQ